MDKILAQGIGEAPKPATKGGLSERLVARGGFYAPRLNTAQFKSGSTLSLPSGVRSPLSTIPHGLSPITLLDSPVLLSNSQSTGIMKESRNKWKGLPLPGIGMLNNIHQKATDFICRPPKPPSEDIQILKRLQREAFAELKKMRDKLEMIERQFSFYLSSTQGNLAGGAKTQLKGEVKAGGAFVMMQNGSSQEAYSLLEQARMKIGTEVKFTFETFFRERDLLITECTAGQSCLSTGDVFGGPITLGKVLYSANINESLSLSIVPLGAKGTDTTTILNPLKDQALTGFFATGPDLFRHCQGSALGATIKVPNLSFSIGKYLSGWGDQSQVSSLHGFSEAEVCPLCLSTLGQLLFQPSEGIKLACSGLNRYWPSPCSSSRAFKWSKIGPLILSNIHLKGFKSCGSSSNSFLTQPSGLADSSNSKGISAQSVAFSVDAEFSEGMRIGGWLQMEREGWLQEPDRKSLQWALCLSGFPDDGLCWGLNIGQSRQDPYSMQRSKEMNYHPDKLPQIQLEAFLKIDCGKGFTLQPGLVHVTNRNAQIPALMLRFTWSL